VLESVSASVDDDDVDVDDDDVDDDDRRTCTSIASMATLGCRSKHVSTEADTCTGGEAHTPLLPSLLPPSLLPLLPLLLPLVTCAPLVPKPLPMMVMVTIARFDDGQLIRFGPAC
jgi:hypothetical protein